MTNLLNTVRGVLSDNVMGKIASLIGSNSGVTKTAMTTMLPSLMKGIISKGSSTAGAGDLINLIKNNNLGEGTLNNLSSSLGGGNASNAMMDTGAKLNEAIFGKDGGNISAAGLNAGESSKLRNIATPILMGTLGKVVKKENLDANGLQSYLKKQGMDVVKDTKAATHATAERRTTATAERKSGGGIMKWLIPLFLLLGAGWFFTQYMNGNDGMMEKEATADTETKAATSTQATHTHADGTTHAGHSHGDATSTATDAAGSVMDKAGAAAKDAAGAAAGAVTGAAGDAGAAVGLSLDSDGNLLKDGKMFLEKGKFTVKDGEYFSADGKSLGFIGKVGKAIGDAGKAVGGAVAGAAGKTADAFKDVFGGMFKKKKSGEAVAAYTLSQIVFDPESNRITDFSKNEVQGLAEALKATPDAKIKVQVSSADGADKGVTKDRAKVVHDMLVTLGVADKQIDAEGMGAGDGKVNIVIE